MKNKFFLGLGICLMGFLMACDDSSSASSENNSSPAADTPATQSDVFTLKESFKYTVTYDVAEQECSRELDITDVELKFGPGNAVKVTTTDAEGTEVVSGVYAKETDDGEDQYLIQINDDGENYNFIYVPGNEGVFVLAHEVMRIAAVHSQDDADELLNNCGEW